MIDVNEIPTRILYPYETREEGLAKLGRFVQPADIDTIVEESETGIRPDGSHVYTLIRNAVPYEMARVAYPIVLRAGLNKSVIGGTRFMAAGVKPELRVRADGTTGNRTEVPDRPWLRGASEGVLGALEKPECRLTTITSEHWDQYVQLFPLAQHLNDIFRTYCPLHHMWQAEASSRIDPSYLLKGTVCTTATCNKNFATALHIDQGDLPEGRGVLTMFTGGKFTGGELAYPQYRLAVRYRMLDVLITDNHQPHGNLTIIGDPKAYIRLALILYFRSGLLKRCPSL